MALGDLCPLQSSASTVPASIVLTDRRPQTPVPQVQSSLSCLIGVLECERASVFLALLLASWKCSPWWIVLSLLVENMQHSIPIVD